MVLNFFGFSSYPFSKSISYKNLFHTKTYKEAFARLEFGTIGEDILLLTGQAGTGKSLCLNAFINSIDINKYLPIYLRGNDMSTGELYKAVLDGINIEPPYNTSVAKRIFFKTIPELSKKPIVIIDDTQDLKDSALSNIKSMVNFDFDSKNKITFILTGQPELRKKLNYSQFNSLRQRIRISYNLREMSLEETCGYIEHHIKLCGYPNSIFSDDAKSNIFNISEGVPRKINTICFNAILKAASAQQKIIDSSDIFQDDLI